MTATPARDWWLRRIGWRRDEDDTDAIRAMAEAAATLEAVRARSAEVSRLADEERARSDRNGFVKMLSDAMHLKEV